MPEGPALLPHHWQLLTEESGISPEVIAERGYRSILSPGGYADLPGLLLPLWTADGKNGLMV